MSKIKSGANWPIVFVAYFTLFTLGLLDNSRGPYFPDITADLKLSDTEASLFFVVVSFMAFLSGLLVPTLARRVGLIRLLRLGQILMGLGFGLITLAHSLSTLILTCAIFGCGFGLINVTQNLLIIGSSTGELRRRLLSGLHGMYAFASLIAPLIVAHLFRIKILWREAYVGFALFVVASLVSTFFIESKNIPIEKKAEPNRPKNRAYLLVGALLSFYVVSEVLIVTRISLYARRLYDYSPDEASILMALFFLCLLAGRFLFLFVPFKSANLKIIEMSLVMSFVIYFLGLYVHPWLLALCGLTMAPVFALTVDLIAELFPNHSSDALAFCLALSCAFIVSMHFVAGVISDIYGIGAAMHTGLFTLFISWLLLSVLKRSQLRSAAYKN